MQRPPQTTGRHLCAPAKMSLLPLPALQAEFISKIIPDPIETGVVDALRRLVTPLARGLSA